MKPYYEDSHATLYLADALDVIPTLEPCDAVITDPPYMIGAKSVGGKKKTKAGSWTDLMNAAYWYRAWIAACWQRLTPQGYLVSFTNWRSLPMMLKACALADVPVNSCAVWDKEWIGPAAANQLRPQYEMLLFCAQPRANIANRSASDVFRQKWMAGHNSTTGHPAEKPVVLMQEVLTLITRPGDRVVDPFVGGGTTLVSAKSLDIRSIGCEGEECWAETTARRLERTAAGEALA